MARYVAAVYPGVYTYVHHTRIPLDAPESFENRLTPGPHGTVVYYDLWRVYIAAVYQYTVVS